MLLRECQAVFPMPDKEEANFENSIFPNSETGCYSVCCYGRMTDPALQEIGLFAAFVIY